MCTLIVVESLFGNTRDIADAVADGARRAGTGDVEVTSAGDPVPDLDGVSLLVLGGPTHAFSMTRARTRRDAARYGPVRGSDRGLREWITEAAGAGSGFTGRAVTFDTKIRRIPGSAAARAARALRRQGFRTVERGPSFWVTGTTGPLLDGEIERARAWGRSISTGTEVAPTRGVVTIRDSLTIARPLETVFEFAADQRNEPLYNPAMVRCDKTTAGPIGVGTRFDSELRRRRGAMPMTSEITAYDPPHCVTTRTTMPGAAVTGSLSFDAESNTSTRMRWDWELRPHGWIRFAASLLAPLARRFERRIWTRLRDHLQAGRPAAAPRAQPDAEARGDDGQP